MGTDPSTPPCPNPLPATYARVANSAHSSAAPGSSAASAGTGAVALATYRERFAIAL